MPGNELKEIALHGHRVFYRGAGAARCSCWRVCLLEFGLMRELDADYIDGERDVMRALADRDPAAVHAGLKRLGYLPDPTAVEPDAVTEFLTTAGAWLLVPGYRRLDPEQVAALLEIGYPPRSPFFHSSVASPCRRTRCCYAA